MLAAHAAMPVCSAAGVMTAMQPCMGSGRLAVYVCIWTLKGSSSLLEVGPCAFREQVEGQGCSCPPHGRPEDTCGVRASDSDGCRPAVYTALHDVTAAACSAAYLMRIHSNCSGPRPRIDMHAWPRKLQCSSSCALPFPE